MLRGDIGSKNLLNGAVDALGVAISLRMIGGGEVECGAQSRSEGSPKITGEARVSIRDDDRG